MSGQQRPEREAIGVSLGRIHKRCDDWLVGETSGYNEATDLISDIHVELGNILAALPPTPTPGWQPMATVPYPRDGKPFLVWWPKHPARPGDGDYADTVGGHKEYEEILGYGEVPASHWMRPAPPTATPGWQDISTAPKDGTRVLLWWPYWNHTRPLVGYWSEGDWHASERLEGSSEQPQGWQPLPPIPTGDRS
jgi:hypothetical protein